MIKRLSMRFYRRRKRQDYRLRRRVLEYQGLWGTTHFTMESLCEWLDRYLVTDATTAMLRRVSVATAYRNIDTLVQDNHRAGLIIEHLEQGVALQTHPLALLPLDDFLLNNYQQPIPLSLAYSKLKESLLPLFKAQALLIGEGHIRTGYYQRKYEPLMKADLAALLAFVELSL